jgi:hypothetical protein
MLGTLKIGMRYLWVTDIVSIRVIRKQRMTLFGTWMSSVTLIPKQAMELLDRPLKCVDFALSLPKVRCASSVPAAII